MSHNFPFLPDVPERPSDLIYAFDPETSRPRIWDENGMPLDSYYSEKHRPSRLPEDYDRIAPGVNFTPRIVPDSEGYGLNIGLMGYIRPNYPETLHLVLDAARAYREVRAIPEDAPLPIDQALTTVVGLNSLWALMMYRRQNRVANGELPAHVANVHRVLIGYEGVLSTAGKALEDFGIARDGVVLPLGALTQMALGGLKSQISHERCPANPGMIKEGMVALVDPPEQAHGQLISTLSRCEDPRLLYDMHIDDGTFTHFALGMRQLMSTKEEGDFAVVRAMLQTA